MEHTLTNEELEQYCSENEPIEIIRDEVGRWVKRVWVDGSFETYTYKYDVATLLSNKDITKYRDAYTIVSVERKEAVNG